MIIGTKYGAITTNADFLYSSTHEFSFMVLLIFINLIGATDDY